MMTSDLGAYVVSDSVASSGTATRSGEKMFGAYVDSDRARWFGVALRSSVTARLGAWPVSVRESSPGSATGSVIISFGSKVSVPAGGRNTGELLNTSMSGDSRINEVIAGSGLSIQARLLPVSSRRVTPTEIGGSVVSTIDGVYVVSCS